MDQLARDQFVKQHSFFFGHIPSLEDTMFVQEAAINNDQADQVWITFCNFLTQLDHFPVGSDHQNSESREKPDLRRFYLLFQPMQWKHR